MSHEALPVRVYLTVFGLLILLTVITVGVALMNLGFFNLLAAMTIACIKMVLVGLYFMHLRYSEQLTRFAAAAGLLWLVILLALTLSDYISRDWFQV